MKKFAIILVSVILVLVIAPIVAVRFIDWNAYKPEIVAAVKENTGRDLVIGGDIDLTLLPRIDFTIRDVKLANGEGFRDPQMVTVESVRGNIALFPLLFRNLQIEELVITKPVLNLEVDAKGRANWILGTTAPTYKASVARTQPSEGLPVSNLRLGDVRLLDGLVTYQDARTGQQITAKSINVKAELANLDSPLSVSGDLTVNEEPVTLKMVMNSLGGLQNGQRATLNTALQSKRFQMLYDGGVRQKPLPALDGVFDLSIPSVGALAQWLQRPLAKGQPDPGGLKVHALLEGEGTRMVLKEAKIDGAGAQARASGTLDASGKVTLVKFDLQAGVIDVDRYLPPPAKAPIAKARSAPSDRLVRRDVFAAISDEPIDLSTLRKVAGDINIRIDGIKALGYALGRIAFDTKLGDGKVAANLSEFRLYDGNITGEVKLDATGKALAADTSFDIEKVNVGALARVAQGDAAKVAGIASGKLRAKAQGKSPRALVEGLVARVDLKLGGIAVKEAPGTISKLDLVVDIPGMQQKATLRGNVVYNKEPIAISVYTAPVPSILSGKPFATKLSIEAKHLRLSYDGALQAEPVPGLDGRLSLDVPSVGRLLDWLETPLPKGQPDPGPVTLVAVLAAEGPKLELKEAAIGGKALKVKAVAKVDASPRVPQFDATIDLLDADINAYLPAREDQRKKKPAPQKPAGWSDEPIDLSALHKAEGKATVKIGRVRYGDVRIEAGTAIANLTKGTLKTVAEKVKLAEGVIDLDTTVDASKASPAINYQVTLSGVQARPVLKTFAGTDRLSGKLEFQTTGKTTGTSQKQMVERLNGQGRFMFRDGAIHGINIPKALRTAKTLGFNATQEEKTDFAELSGRFVINDGVLENKDLNMLAPLLRVTGAGVVPMPPRTIDYKVEAKLVGTLKGQGGQDALAGLPIPIAVKGSWDSPSISVDWKDVLTAAAKDPQRLANMPSELRNLGKSLGVKLPIPDTGAAGEILKRIPGLPGAQSPQQPGPAAKAPAPAAPPSPAGVIEQLMKPKSPPPDAAAGQQQKQPPAESGGSDALKGLQQLFGK